MYSQNFCEGLGSALSFDLNIAATPCQKLTEAATSVLSSKQWHGKSREDQVDSTAPCLDAKLAGLLVGTLPA